MNLISLSDAAVSHIKKQIDEMPNGIGFRLSIKKTGCSGFAYVPAIIKEKLPQDLHFSQEGVDIYIDPAIKDFINGLMIDYAYDHSMGLKQKRLVYQNPQEKNRCGCGESFTIEDNK